MDKIILIGGGGHCKSVIDVIEYEGKFKIAGIVDKPELLGKKILNYKVIGNDKDLDSLAKKYKYALITIGQIKSPSIRVNLFNKALNAGFKMANVVSPRAYISKFAKIGIGNAILHDVLINSHAVVGDNCIINSKALIEHDAQIKNNCHISTGAIINGSSIVGNNSFIGSNSCIKQNISVQKNSIVNAGIFLSK